MDLKGSAFKISLCVLEIFGVYQPNITKWSIIRTILMLNFTIVQFLILSFIEIFYVKNFSELIVAAIYVIYSLNLTCRLVFFAVMQKKVIELINEIEENEKDQPKFKENSKKILKFMGSLLASDLLIGLSLSLSIIFFGSKKSFTIPQLYYPDNDALYYTMFVVHYFQIIGIGSISHGEQKVH